MTCDQARREFESLDELPQDAAQHVATCPGCQTFLTEVRAAVERLRDVPTPPDLLTGSLVEVRRARRSRRLVPLVSLAAGLAIGALTMLGWLAVQQTEESPAPQVVASITERLAALLPQSEQFSAAVTVTESGWHQEVPHRTYTGSLVVEAPERFQLLLRDNTDYPDERWMPNDLEVTIDEDRFWIDEAVGCTPELLPECSRRMDPTSAVGRAPFDPTTEVFFEIAVPIQTWAGSENSSVPTDEPPSAGAAGIEISAVQAAPILDAFLSHGAWRDVYPADRVTVWIDPDSLVPIEISVKALNAPSRAAWAASLGYSDGPDVAYLEIILTPDDSMAFEAIPTRGSASTFVEGSASFDPLPGFEPYRSGAVVTSSDWTVRSWTQGFAWIRIDEVADWEAQRFPGAATPVIPMTSPAYGTAYLGIDGSRLFVHTAESELVVSTNAGIEKAFEAIGSLDVEGIPAPDGWGLDLTVGFDVADAPGLLFPSDFRRDVTAVSEDERGIVMTAWLGGDEFFELAQRAGDRLPLPSGASPTGVVVRNTTARYLPELGRLEWLETGNVISLTIRGADLTRLAAFAEDLEYR